MAIVVQAVAVILLGLTFPPEVNADCDLTILETCELDPVISLLFLEDPCTYYKTLEQCILPQKAQCQNEAQFQAKLQDYDLAKGIFCTDEQGCDMAKVQACFRYLDPLLLNTSDPMTFGPFCYNGFDEFAVCFNEAVVKCLSDDTFIQSGILQLVQIYDLVCASVGGCDVFGLSVCTSHIGNSVEAGVIIPGTAARADLCLPHTDFINCVGPKIDSCLQLIQTQVYRYADVVTQMVALSSYLNLTCSKYETVLDKHSKTCYDVNSVKQSMTSCSEQINGEIPPDGSNATCALIKRSVTCTHNTLTSQCSTDAALIGAAFLEEVSIVSSSVTGVACQPMGYYERLWNSSETSKSSTTTTTEIPPVVTTKTTKLLIGTTTTLPLPSLPGQLVTTKAPQTTERNIVPSTTIAPTTLRITTANSQLGSPISESPRHLMNIFLVFVLCFLQALLS